MAVVGGLVLYAVAYLLLPLWDMATVAMRTAFLAVLCHITIVVPIGRRFPFLFKGIARKCKRAVADWVRRLRSRFLKEQVTATDKFEGDAKQRLTDEDWTRVCQKIGTKTTLGRSERLGKQDAVGDCMYRLVSGEVAIVNDGHELGTEIALGAPLTLLQTNALLGHGRQTQVLHPLLVVGC